LAAQLDQAAVIQTISDMENFGNRFTNSTSEDGRTGIGAARDYLRDRLNALANNCNRPANFYEDSFPVTYQLLNSVQSNLVLEVVGSESGKNVVVIGAHYDTMSKLDRASADFAKQPGADDNGSGVAAVLELARLMCLAPRAQSFVFVLFAAEEIRTETQNGRVGSTQFVSNFIPRFGWRVEFMLNLDTIGSATDENGRKVNLARIYSASPVDSRSRQLARWMQAAAFVQLPNFEVVVENREDRENRWGDHMSFSRAGYPAARLLEGAEDTRRQDSPFDRLNDLDPPYLLNNIRVVLALLLAESEGPPPPGDIRVIGRQILWEAIPGAYGYLVAWRNPQESNYQFELVTTPNFSLPPNVIFSLGTVGGEGLLGELSPEAFSSQ
jgi:hypothetical protein